MQYSLPTMHWVRLPDGTDPERLPQSTRDVTDIIRAAAAAGFRAIGLDTVTVSGFRGAHLDTVMAPAPVLAPRAAGPAHDTVTALGPRRTAGPVHDTVTTPGPRRTAGPTHDTVTALGLHTARRDTVTVPRSATAELNHDTVTAADPHTAGLHHDTVTTPGRRTAGPDTVTAPRSRTAGLDHDTVTTADPRTAGPDRDTVTTADAGAAKPDHDTVAATDSRTARPDHDTVTALGPRRATAGLHHDTVTTPGRHTAGPDTVTAPHSATAELHHDTVTTADPTGDAGRAIAELLRSAGIRVTDVGVLSVGGTDDRASATALARLAATTGATHCVTVLQAEPSAAVLAGLRSCAAILAEAGARLALEFLPYGPLPTLEDAIDVCAAVGWQRCGLLLDSWHFFRSGAPWTGLERIAGEQISMVQINDAPPMRSDDLRFESRFRRVLPGRGEFDLQRWRGVLCAAGYDGIVSPEVLSSELIDQPLEVSVPALHAALVATWPLTA